MRNKLIFAILTLAMVILMGIYTGFSGLVTSASSQVDTENNEIVFSIPVGENGIHYEGNNSSSMLTWGPTTLAVAPDGTFWIADAADNHILHYNLSGILLNRIDIGDLVVGAGDLEVTNKELWVLDMASIPPKVVQLSLNGETQRIFDLPKGLYLEDGLSGIGLGTDGWLYIELDGGRSIIRFISSSGRIEHEILEGYESQGKIYSAHAKDNSHGYILTGDNQISVEVVNELVGLSILHINSDGSFFVKITEVAYNGSFQVDQTIHRYDSSGNLVGMARVPLVAQYTYVVHGIAVGPDDEVYALITKPDGGEIQRLKFHTDLSPILPPQNSDEDKAEMTQVITNLSENCRPRSEIINTAAGYFNNSTWISSYHIDDNPTCPERVKPRYLSGAGTYTSVPYAWNQWDTVSQFNSLMNGGINGYFAGNTSKVYAGCARGVDCSGLVSRAWNLVSHTDTCSLPGLSTALTSTDYLQPGDIMNLCQGTSGHTIIFIGFTDDEKLGMSGYEALVDINSDRVVKKDRLFEDLIAEGYIPLRYNGACFRTMMPLLRNSMLLNLSSFIPDPYPSPNLDTSPNPYPYP